MFRKASMALVLLALCFTFAAADEIKGRITKIDGKNVTVVVGKSDAKPYDLAQDCKFYFESKTGKVEIKDGARAQVFKKIPDKGLSAQITTNTTNRVTVITLMRNPVGK